MYDTYLGRDDAEALMPEDVSNAFLGVLGSASVVLSRFQRVPVSRKSVRMPVLSMLPQAYFVNGDTGLKRTTKVAWDSKELHIEEIAAIVPIPDAVIDDAETPIWSQVQPLLVNAAGRALDAAVFFGVDAPETWPASIEAAARAAGNVQEVGEADPAEGGLVVDHGDLLSLIEEGGHNPSSGVASGALKAHARRARNARGDRFNEVAIGENDVTIDGVSYSLEMPGLWPAGDGAPLAIPFDPTQFVVGVRQDITWKLLTEAALTNADGEIVYNLPQQDMTALRMVLRVGWQVANTINYQEEVEANRYPAGVLIEATSEMEG